MLSIARPSATLDTAHHRAARLLLCCGCERAHHHHTRCRTAPRGPKKTWRSEWGTQEHCMPATWTMPVGTARLRGPRPQARVACCTVCHRRKPANPTSITVESRPPAQKAAASSATAVESTSDDDEPVFAAMSATAAADHPAAAITRRQLGSESPLQQQLEVLLSGEPAGGEK